MGSLRMHTLNIEAARKHAIDMVSNFAPLTGGGTPLSLNTPDILNSLISITSNPFFESSTTLETQSTGYTNSDAQTQPTGIEEDKKVFATLEVPPTSGPSSSQTNSYTPSIIVSPPQVSTVQSLRSQFIKDSLKLTIQTKRKSSGKVELDVQADLQVKVRKKEELTPEDEERRKRRRERNKVAATKCRNKKKEKTGLLVIESQTLETNNVSLKSEISQLEEERQRLMEVLAAHAPACIMKTSNNDSHPLRITNLNQMNYNSREYSGISTAPSPYYYIQQSTRQHLSAQRT